MIISVSRRTDIPAYYADWFFNRLTEGYALVRNPVNYHQVSQVDLRPEHVDCFVFWTKNPAPVMNRLNLLSDYSLYFQFTLTPYEQDVEPGLTEKSVLINTFCRLAEQIGPEKVVWRYDPILLSEKYSLAFHQEAFARLAKLLQGSATHCIISFLDLYPAIRQSLAALTARAPSTTEKLQLAESFSHTAAKHDIQLSTCAEGIDLSQFSITHSCCIDPKRISQITGLEVNKVKDKNQRPECGCLQSVDLGAYSTCPSGCRYCYANSSPAQLSSRTKQYDPLSPLLGSTLTEADRVTPRAEKSLLSHQLSLFVL